MKKIFIMTFVGLLQYVCVASEFSGKSESSAIEIHKRFTLPTGETIVGYNNKDEFDSAYTIELLEDRLKIFQSVAENSLDDQKKYDLKINEIALRNTAPDLVKDIFEQEASSQLTIANHIIAVATCLKERTPKEGGIYAYAQGMIEKANSYNQGHLLFATIIPQLTIHDCELDDFLAMDIPSHVQLNLRGIEPGDIENSIVLSQSMNPSTPQPGRARAQSLSSSSIRSFSPEPIKQTSHTDAERRGRNNESYNPFNLAFEVDDTTPSSPLARTPSCSSVPSGAVVSPSSSSSSSSSTVASYYNVVAGGYDDERPETVTLFDGLSGAVTQLPIKVIDDLTRSGKEKDQHDNPITSAHMKEAVTTEDIFLLAEADEKQGNVLKAVDQYYELAGRHYPAAQMKLRSVYKAKQGIFENLEKALEYYEQKVATGEVVANIIVGWIYRDGFLNKNGCEVKDEKKAFANFEKAANQGFAIAQDSLGWMYLNGRGISQNVDQALYWYTQAANQGLALAQFNLGWIYQNGKGVKQDYEKAVKWYKKAAEKDFADAQNNLGSMYQHGRGVKQDDDEAVKWYKKATKHGDADAQYNLGWMYQNGQGVQQSNAKAFKWYAKAAKQNFANAQNNLGMMCAYSRGRGVPQSDVEAIEWFTKAAKQGHAGAQFNLRMMYLNGQGVPQSDVDEAIKWVTEVAEQGYAPAQCSLGMMYLNGQGVPQSDVEAVKWLTKAAEQDFAIAQNNLGWMYQNGQGTNAEAFKWYARAAEQEFPIAQNNLGAMYKNGLGIQQSDIEAFKWYAKAANRGFTAAQFILGWMYKNGEGVLQSDAKAVEWFSKAAQEGYAPAQFNLRWMLEGQGVPQSDVEAVKGLTKAAEQVDAMKQSNLEVDQKKQSEKEDVPQSNSEAIYSSKVIEQGNAAEPLNLWEMPNKEQGVSQSNAETNERDTEQQFNINFSSFLSPVWVR